MIGAAPGRIAAMVGSDDEQIVRFQTRQQIGQSAVERFQGGGIPHDIPTMSVAGIEIDEVREQKTAVLQRIETFQGPVEQSFVAVALQDSPGSTMRENIADLA